MTCNEHGTCRSCPVNSLGVNICEDFPWAVTHNLPRSFCSSNSIRESRWSPSDQCCTPTQSLKTNVERKAGGYLRGGRKIWGNYHIPKMLSLPKELWQIVRNSDSQILWKSYPLMLHSGSCHCEERGGLCSKQHSPLGTGNVKTRST